jgi:curved DNA-binding protein CbpA
MSLDKQETDFDPVFLERIEYLYGKLDSIDFYSFLGIQKSDTQEKIKKAYYDAVKEFHPDRHLSTASDSLRNKLNVIFTHITKAYKTLSDPHMKAMYDKKLSSRKANLKDTEIQNNKEVIARTRFTEGKKAFVNKLYDDAKELFGQALYLDSTVPEYYFHLGLVLMKQKNYHEAAKMFSKAVALAPLNADYLAELGHVFLDLGFLLRAKSTFQKAIQYNSSHKRAREGLELVEKRP